MRALHAALDGGVEGHAPQGGRGPATGVGALRWVAVTVASAVVVGGCGTPCQQVRARHDAFLARTARAPGPHLRVLAPVGSLNHLLADRVRRLKPVPVALPGVRGLPVRLEGWTLALTRMNLGPAAGGRVSVLATLALRQGGLLVTEADVTAEVEPRLEGPGEGQPSRLVIPLRGRDLRGARLRLGRDLRRAFDDLLRDHLPGALRGTLPRALTDRAAGELATWLSEHLFELARDHLLERVGELTTLSLQLPGLPLRGLRVRWRRAVLALDVTTTLPVRRPLPALPRLGSPGRGVRLVLGASTAAAFYNWLAARGAVPARVDRQGDPDPAGPYEVYAVAPPDAEPWGLRAWDLGRCVEVDLVGTPRARVDGGRVQVRVEDGRVERAYGPPAFEAETWLWGLTAEALRASASFAATVSLTVGGERSSVRLRRAEVRGEAIVLDADWSAAAPATSARGPVARPSNRRRRSLP